MLRVVRITNRRPATYGVNVQAARPIFELTHARHTRVHYSYIEIILHMFIFRVRMRAWTKFRVGAERRGEYG